MAEVRWGCLSDGEGSCDTEVKPGEADSAEGLAGDRLVFITGSAGRGPVGGGLIVGLEGRGSAVAMMAAVSALGSFGEAKTQLGSRPDLFLL